RHQNGDGTVWPPTVADAGEGFVFLGVRNADGTIPNPANPGGLGDQALVLPSQQSAGMDINLREINEFAILNWRHQFNPFIWSQLALTGLHSEQAVSNNNPAVNPLNLPIDDSIEYNPNVSRNAHHLQLTGSITAQR